MRYATGGAFRTALEERLTAQSLRTGLPLLRLRKMVAFERLLARLVKEQPDAWLLKGGLALQLRLGDRARTTQDLDMLLMSPTEDLHATLVHAALLDLGDWFLYLVQQPTRTRAREVGGLRFTVQSRLDGRPFETFHLDIGWGDRVVESPDHLTAPSLLAFAEIQPTAVPCYPLTQHVAEKIHAYTRPHLSGESSRVKDLVDIVLIVGMRNMRASTLRTALRATFEARRTHPMPPVLPSPPASWAVPYRRLAREVGLETASLDKGVDLAQRFLDPILSGRTRGLWDPRAWAWSD